MDWEDLRHFLALADAGSFSRAAKALKVDHTTVARRVAGLEAALGLALVERRPRAVTLTEEGARIAALGDAAEDAVFAIMRAAEGADRSLSGPVCISAPPAFANVVLAPRMTTLVERHPRIAVTLLGEVTDSNLSRRQADIAVRLSRPEARGLVMRKLGEMPFAFYAAKTYRKAERHWAFIAYDERSSGIPQHGWLEARLDGRPVVLHTNDLSSQAAAVRAGLGVALLPCFLGESDPGLRLMPSAHVFPPRDIWMAVHEDLRKTPRMRAVMDFLVETVRDAR